MGLNMKKWTVTIRFQGLTGEYTSKVDVLAKTAASAKKKAARVIGNRDGYVVTVCEGFTEGHHNAAMVIK